MNVYDTAQPYVASYIIFRRGNEIAFVLRQNTQWMNGYYGLPAGKVEHDERFKACAVREAKEEAGVDVQEDDLEFVHTCHRSGNTDGTSWVDMFYEVKKYSGELHNAEPHMHGGLAWLDINNLPKNVIPSTAFVIENIKEGIPASEYGWSNAEQVAN